MKTKTERPWLLPVVLLVVLIVATYLQLFLYRPSYSALFWMNALAPVGYLGGFFLYRFIDPAWPRKE